MLSSLAFLLAAVPCTLAATAYVPPAAFLAKANAAGCSLPENFHVKDFEGVANANGSSLDNYRFTFADAVTNMTTNCQFNSSSVSTTPSATTPRYACDKGSGNVKFIFQGDTGRLTLIERVCPGSDGKDDYEVSGSVHVQVACKAESSKCAANSTDYDGQFTSINPVTDPTLLKYQV